MIYEEVDAIGKEKQGTKDVLTMKRTAEGEPLQKKTH